MTSSPGHSHTYLCVCQLKKEENEALLGVEGWLRPCVPSTIHNTVQSFGSSEKGFIMY